MNKVYIIENFVEKKDLQFINLTLRTTEPSKHSVSQEMYDSDARMAKITDMYIDLGQLEGLTKLCETYLSSVHDKIKSIYNVHVDKEEGIGITVLGVGHSMPVHVDKGYGDEKSDHNFKTPSGFPTREISSLIYWNDDYLGGEICFPNQSITLKPKAGTLILFPSNNNFPHQVLPVTQGLRYVSTNFWHCDWD